MASVQLTHYQPFKLQIPNATVNEAGEVVANLSSVIDGDIDADTLVLSGDAEVGGELLVTGDTEVGGALAVTGAVTAPSVTAATVTASSTLDASAATVIKLPAANALNQYPLQIFLKDIIGANGAVGYVVVPVGGAGTIQQIDAVLDNTTATGSLVLTSSIGATPVTLGVVTIASATAAGTAATPATPSAAKTVAAGNVVKIVCSGTQSAAGTGMVTLTIRRTVQS